MRIRKEQVRILLVCCLVSLAQRSYAQDDQFQFGIEYGVPGLAEDYARSGCHMVKPTPALVMWRYVQPSKGAAYNWQDIDRHVQEYQSAGFDTLQLLISAESPWASRGVGALKVKDGRPKPQLEADYVKFVQAVVERYDMDGVDDMPGLLYPINQWGIEREFTNFFPGPGEDYVEVLKLAYPAIKKANPHAKVLCVAILAWDVFQGNPSDSEIRSRLANPRPIGRKDGRDISVLLDAYQYFDIVDFHSLGDYSEIVPTVQWIRVELRKRGAADKEIYIGDCFPMSPLLGYGFETCRAAGPAAAKEAFPVTSATRCEAAKLISALRKPLDPRHKAAHAWLERNIAISLVKKYVVAANAGVMGVNMGNLEDWPIPFGGGTCQYMGMADTKHTKGTQFNATRTVTAWRPAFYALKMVIAALDGFDSVKRAEVKADSSVHIYEFINKGKKIVVVWYDDGQFYGLDKPTPQIKVAIPWRGDSATITYVPTERNMETIRQEEAQVRDNKITLDAGYAPVFIE